MHLLRRLASTEYKAVAEASDTSHQCLNAITPAAENALYITGLDAVSPVSICMQKSFG